VTAAEISSGDDELACLAMVRRLLAIRASPAGFLDLASQYGNVMQKIV
jgi:hypothetical protein